MSKIYYNQKAKALQGHSLLYSCCGQRHSQRLQAYYLWAGEGGHEGGDAHLNHMDVGN